MVHDINKNHYHLITSILLLEMIIEMYVLITNECSLAKYSISNFYKL